MQNYMNLALAFWRSLPSWLQHCLVIFGGIASGVIKHQLVDSHDCLTGACVKGYVIAGAHAGAIAVIAYLVPSPLNSSGPKEPRIVQGPLPAKLPTFPGIDSTLKEISNMNARTIAFAIVLCFLLLFVAGGLAAAQTPSQPSAFQDTTVSFNLTPISLPGAKSTIGGAETDILLPISTNNVLGETTIVDSGYEFFGGRFNRKIPQFSTWLNNQSPVLNGYQFELSLTASVGVVDLPGAVPAQKHWGERAGFNLNYSINGTIGLALEAQWNNFPGYAHNAPSVAFGPNFHF